MEKTEIKDFKIRAYRTVEEGDKKFQNWQYKSTVELQLVVEIDGIELPILVQSLPHGEWSRAIKNFGKTKA